MNEPGSWVLSHEVTYGPRAPEGAFDALDQNIINSLKTGNLSPREGNYILNMPVHQHLKGGSGGIAFFYVLQADYKVGIHIHAISNKRQGNNYTWVGYGGSMAGPPAIMQPADVAARNASQERVPQQ
ncbi:hypothetical protein GXW82_41760 [Streptacidiphilus sp. 4-A2]|nr:hypothetical protein [Streptacidiphilus sp. 4-A2]